jgi:hypothetical protein
MLNQSDTLRVMAAKYLRMAKSAADPSERSKFFSYAMFHAQMSEQAERSSLGRSPCADASF